MDSMDIQDLMQLSSIA